MKVVDQTLERQKPRISLTTSVPVGQVFRGTLIGVKSGLRYVGVFYKHHANHTIVRDTRPNERCAGLVVQLTGDRHDRSGIFLRATRIENYEPLDVELVIKGVL